MAKTTKQTEEQKLKLLYKLQIIDSSIDEIKTLRGELPIQVKDLEDELVALDTRVSKIKEEVENLNQSISDRKNQIVESEDKIVKYEKQQNTVKNNREFDSLSKEIEFQKLEVELSEKRIKEYKEKIKLEKEKTKHVKALLKDKKAELKEKKSELEEITGETKIEEDKLLKESASIIEQIEEKLAERYSRIRNNVKNGIAIASIDRGSCGGCHNRIPPQIQLDIAQRKKIISCEHCGRIVVDELLADEIK